GGLLGRNYLDFCPPDTHGDLLRLHKLKVEGQTVRFRFDLGADKVLTVTSGPVRVEDRLYLYVLARKAEGPPQGDEVLVGMVAGAPASTAAVSGSTGVSSCSACPQPESGAEQPSADQPASALQQRARRRDYVLGAGEIQAFQRRRVGRRHVGCRHAQDRPFEI